MARTKISPSSSTSTIEHVLFNSWKTKNKIRRIEFFTTKTGRFSATLGEITIMTTVGFDNQQEAYIIPSKDKENMLWVYNKHQPKLAFVL